MMRRTLFAAVALLALASLAWADQVTLKNGDRLTGTIVVSDGKTLLLKTELAGDVTIQWAAVTALESGENLNFTLKDGKRISGRVSTQDGKLLVAGTPADKDTILAVRNDAEQKTFDAAAEKIAHPKFTYFWGGQFDTGLALTRGNSATVSYTLATKAVRQTSRDKLSLYANYIYANDDSTPPSRTTANELRAGARGDLNIGPKLFVFAFTDFETNELQHLDLRGVFGGGFGWHVIKTSSKTFDVFGGISYDHDSFGTYSIANPLPPPPATLVAAISRSSAEAVLGEEFAWKLSKKTNVSERFSFFPNLSRTGDYRFQLDTSAATQLKTWLSWQTTFSDHYISYPPLGLKGNDLLLSTGLRVTWGKAKL